MLIKHAVVIGAGIAGLLHARVLADYAEQVTIIDRDELPDQPEMRGGVPQAAHVHYLMVRGLQIMDALLPGLEQAIVASGAPEVKVGIHTRYMLYQEWAPTIDAGLHTYVIDRPRLEQMVRQRVLGQPNIAVMSRTEALDLVLSAGRVTGVVTRKRPAQGDPETIPADVIVDASGRQSKALDWLERAGYPLPPVTKIDAQLGYASRWYTQPANVEPDWRILYIMASPPRQTRGGAIFAHEEGRWMVSLGGTNGDHPTTDEADFLEFARSLPDPVIYDAIKDAQPLTGIQGFRNTANVWRAFEKLDRLPGGLFVTGDALCEVNPIYGQGMTKAALNALALQAQLAAGNLETRRFYRQAAKINQNFWQSAASGDLNYPGTISTAQESPVARLMRAYFSAVVRGSARDPQVALTFSRVLNVIDPPTDLLKPGMVLRVLRAQRRAPA